MLLVKCLKSCLIGTVREYKTICQYKSCVRVSQKYLNSETACLLSIPYE